MAGSRKGEKRGGAKKRHWNPNPDLHKEGVRGNRKGVKNKPRLEVDQEVVKILASKMAVENKEKKLEMYFLVSGRRSRLPRDVMLSAMRFFEEAAIDNADVMQDSRDMAAETESAEEKAALLTMAESAEIKLRENLSMAVDIAYKAAPYIHARLSAVLTSGGSGDSPVGVLQALLKDMDEAGQPARYIDHEPQAENMKIINPQEEAR